MHENVHVHASQNYFKNWRFIINTLIISATPRCWCWGLGSWWWCRHTWRASGTVKWGTWCRWHKVIIGTDCGCSRSWNRSPQAGKNVTILVSHMNLFWSIHFVSVSGLSIKKQKYNNRTNIMHNANDNILYFWLFQSQMRKPFSQSKIAYNDIDFCAIDNTYLLIGLVSKDTYLPHHSLEK